MKKIVISLIITFFIWGIGIYGFFYIQEAVPKQLTASSNLIADAEENKDAKEVPQELKEVIHNTQKLVVQIQSENGSLGSGFLYNNKGDVVTNAHVVANVKNVTVKTVDSKELPGTVIGISKDIDVAVVRVQGLSGTTPLEMARDRKGEVGDEVLALGSPLGLQNTVTTGIISGIDRDLDIEPFHYEDVYQISAPITHGNSGGPLIDSNTGEVLGINSAGWETAGSIGFSIPITSVIPLIEGWVDSPMTTIPTLAYETYEENDEEVYSIEDYASYLVGYFYESLNYGDYVTAYSLLGSSWQSNTSYEQFRNGYLNTLSVSIDDLTASGNNDSGTVIAIISADERKDGGSAYSKYKLTYEIGYENEQLKILSGEGEKIK